jgi:UDP-glucose 4-epimerase
MAQAPGEAVEKVLITGIAGGQGRRVARRLLEVGEVVGVDQHPWENCPQGIRMYHADLRKRRFEELLREEKPSAIVHMGFIRHFRASDSARHDFNVRGTQRLLDLCVKHHVAKLVVLSSSYVYGAFAENPYRLDEEAPLSASRSYPEIRDLVEVDSMASAFLWKYPQIRTCVLRPVNVLGPTVPSMAGQFLRQRRVPTVMGFNPMMQFIHEEDVTEAVALALDHGLEGVFNIEGSGEVPLHTAIHETGGTAMPIPEPLIRMTFAGLFRAGLASYPPGVLDYLKYPVTLSGRRFVQATGFRAQFGLPEIFDSVRH